jgi:uncharacterized UPF0160 family protein
MSQFQKQNGDISIIDTVDHMEELVDLFENTGEMSDVEEDFLELLKYTMGMPIGDYTEDHPFDKWTDGVTGAEKKIQEIGERLLRLSTQVAVENKWYNNMYRQDSEELFALFRDADENGTLKK